MQRPDRLSTETLPDCFRVFAHRLVGKIGIATINSKAITMRVRLRRRLGRLM
jgi:hypothetical protein